MDRLIGGGQFHLGQDQAVIAAPELIHVPQHARVPNIVPRFLDQGPVAEARQHRFRIRDRDRVFELRAGDLPLAFDGHEGGRTRSADPHRRAGAE